MNAFTPLDYDLAKEYRNRTENAAQKQYLADAFHPEQEQVMIASRQTLTVLVAAITLFILLVMPRGAEAQDTIILAEAGGSASSQVEAALILGSFYFDNGSYDKAIVQFQTAIVGMPEKLFDLMPEQAIVFWQLGEAQEQAGLLTDALASYQRFLKLAGEHATPYAVDYVLAFELSLVEINA